MVGVMACIPPPSPAHGYRQRDDPSAAETPNMFLCPIDTTWRIPPTSTIIGDAYMPSPFAVHLASPEAGVLVDKSLEGWQRFRIVISSMARKQSAANSSA